MQGSVTITIMQFTPGGSSQCAGLIIDDCGPHHTHCMQHFSSNPIQSNTMRI